jgi:hypothetical protein
VLAVRCLTIIVSVRLLERISIRVHLSGTWIADTHQPSRASTTATRRTIKLAHPQYRSHQERIHLDRRASHRLWHSKFQIPHLDRFSESVIPLDPSSFLQQLHDSLSALGGPWAMGIYLKGLVDEVIVDLEWIVIWIIAFECDSNVRLAP